MDILLLSIIVTYQIIESIIGSKEMKKLIDTKITEKTRVKFYRDTIISGWIPVIIIAIFIFIKSLTLNDIGFIPITFSDYTVLNIITITALSLLLLLLFYQIIMFIVCKGYREALELKINKKKETIDHYDRVINDVMLPKTIKEKFWFFFVSLTAGICEEIICRGTFIYLLQSIFPKLNIIIIVLIISVLFGLLHCYQGIKGIIKTGIIGILFSIIYLITDSLLLCIVVHFIIDFSSAFLLNDKKEKHELLNN